MQNYKLTLCYEGSRYNGWQKQGNTRKTLQEKMESALSDVLGHPVEIAGSGRTDAGVHARMQVTNFRSDTEKAPAQILDELRRRLPEDIGADALEMADARFHARLSCKGKTYVYRIWNSGAPNIFERRVMAAMPGALDMDAMWAAAALLVGKHDFSAFSASRQTKKSTIRTLEALKIERLGDEVRCTLTGNGFLYNMARILVGTLVQVGRGERHPQEMAALLENGDRKQAGPAAPAQGLILWDVKY